MSAWLRLVLVTLAAVIVATLAVRGMAPGLPRSMLLAGLGGLALWLVLPVFRGR